jgi:excisionase family DNA binding protein
MESLRSCEVLALLKVSRPTLHRLVAAGLPSVSIGRVRRFDREAVLRWIAKRGTKLEAPVYTCDECEKRWAAPVETPCPCGGMRRLTPLPSRLLSSPSG